MTSLVDNFLPWNTFSIKHIIKDEKKEKKEKRKKNGYFTNGLYSSTGMMWWPWIYIIEMNKNMIKDKTNMYYGA